MTDTSTDSSRDPAVATALVIGAAMAATVGLALGFQHIGGYIPCKLCLEQRWPYYIGAPLMLLTAYIGAWGASARTVRLLLWLAVAILGVSVYLGAKHAGVEWGWWAGPTDCGAVADVNTGGQGVLDSLNTVIPPSCDKASWRLFGLSFAGWNAAISFGLLLVAVRGAVKGR